MKQKLQRRFALSSKGADDTIRGSLFCALQNVAFMLPVGLLYCLVRDLLNGGLAGRGGFYLIACVACCLFIVVSTWLQYNGTFLATYGSVWPSSCGGCPCPSSGKRTWPTSPPPS